MSVVHLSAGPIDYDDRGSGPPVVLVHGLHMNGSLWRDVVPALERVHRCVVPTLPLGGHATPMHPDADLSPRGVARLLGEFLERIDLTDVTLVGNDTGGALAQLLAAENAARIGRLVLVSCEAFDNFPPGLPGKVSALAARTPGGLYAAAQSMRLAPLARLPFTWGWMAKRPIARDLLDSWFGPLRRSAGVRDDVTRFVRAIPETDLGRAARDLWAFERPALIAWAAEDMVMPLEHADWLAAYLRDSWRVDIRDSFTLVPLDQPRVLAELIAGFAASPDRGPLVSPRERRV